MWRIYSSRDVGIGSFYIKRFWRLVPATVVVVLSYLLFMRFFVGGSSYDNAIESAIATNLYVNNLLLILKSSDYWGVNALYDGLIHTWSLGVEEQFYLLFPLLLFYRKWIGIWMLLGFMFVSMFFSVELSYYNPLGKLWLFLLGIVTSRYLLNWQWKGVLLVLSVLFVVTGYVEWSILTLSTYFLIISGNNIFRFNAKVKFMADLTYSLYLCHVPVLVAFRYFMGDLDSSNNLIALFITILLSLVLQKCIENRFRLWYLKPNQLLRVLVFIGLPLTFYLMLYLATDSSAIKYNMSFADRSFSVENEIIVYGDSKARDFGNVLKEMELGDYISYLDYRDSLKLKELSENVIIFVAMNEIDQIPHGIMKSLRCYYVMDKSFPMTFAKSKVSKEKLFRDIPIDQSREVKAHTMHEKGYLLIDPYNYLYSNNLSLLSVSGKNLSEDGIHLTRFGAEWLAEKNSSNEVLSNILDEIVSKGEMNVSL